MKLIEVHQIIIFEQEMNNADLPDTVKSEIKSISEKFGGYYGRWLLQRIQKKQLKTEDIYKYNDFFSYFEKGKKLNHFTYNDLGKYNTEHLVKEFEKEAIHSDRKLSKATYSGVENHSELVSPSKIKNLENVGIEFLGMSGQYQAFKIPKDLVNNQDAFQSYKNILANCSRREIGEKIHICTMASFDHFNSYLSTDDMYVFFNLRDPKSPYQFHYESNQFMNKNDGSVV